MEKNKIRIDKIQITNDLFIINSTCGHIFTSKINKGSVEFNVYNEDEQEINISNIEEGDIIYIVSFPNKKIDIKEQKNSIIKKILVKNKYVFNSDSSEDLEDDTEKYF